MYSPFLVSSLAYQAALKNVSFDGSSGVRGALNLRNDYKTTHNGWS